MHHVSGNPRVGAVGDALTAWQRFTVLHISPGYLIGIEDVAPSSGGRRKLHSGQRLHRRRGLSVQLPIERYLETGREDLATQRPEQIGLCAPGTEPCCQSSPLPSLPALPVHGGPRLVGPVTSTHAYSLEAGPLPSPRTSSASRTCLTSGGRSSSESSFTFGEVTRPSCLSRVSFSPAMSISRRKVVSI